MNAESAPPVSKDDELPVSVTLEIALRPQLSDVEMRKLSAVAAAEGLNVKGLVIRHMKAIAGGARLGAPALPVTLTGSMTQTA